VDFGSRFVGLVTVDIVIAQIIVKKLDTKKSKQKLKGDI